MRDARQLRVVVQHALKVGCTVQYAWIAADSPPDAGYCQQGLTFRTDPTTIVFEGFQGGK
jgi:hypothetical protein